MKTTRRIFALLLCIVMCVSLVPAAAFAEVDFGDSTEEEEPAGEITEPAAEEAEPAEDSATVEVSPAEETVTNTASASSSMDAYTSFTEWWNSLTEEERMEYDNDVTLAREAWDAYHAGSDSGTDPDTDSSIDPDIDPEMSPEPAKTKTTVTCYPELTASVGVPMEYTWRTYKGEDIESYSLGVLPDGLDYQQTDSCTIVISGSPTTAGTYRFDIYIESTDYIYMYTITLGVISNNGTCGENLTWTLDELTGTVSISGTGAMTDWDSVNDNPWYCQSEKIKRVVISEGVTTIGDLAFFGCSNLTEVTIPSSVTTIGENAFCITSLTDVTIPDGVTTIKDSAFYAGDMTSVTIPASVTEIAGTAFGCCYSLTEFIVDEANETYCAVDGVLYSADKTTLVSFPAGLKINYTIPEGVTAIGEAAFCGCRNPISVTFPGDPITIDENAFLYANMTAYYPVGNDTWTGVISQERSGNVTWLGLSASGTCGAVTDEYPNGENLTWTLDENGLLTIRGTGAMADWTSYMNVPWYSSQASIKSVIMEDGVTNIGYFAFASLSALASVAIPGSVTVIGRCAFEGCSNLVELHIDSIDSWVNINFTDIYSPFYSSSGTHTVYVNGQMITSAEIPSGVTSLPFCVFCNWEQITSVTIPDSVTNIDYSAFKGCSSLTSVTIPDSVTNIGVSAFEGCSVLTSVAIPASVTSVGRRAFMNCGNLTEVIFKGNAPQIQASAFSNDTLTVYYHATNTTWDSIVNSEDNQYGGTITWESYILPSEVPAPAAPVLTGAVTGDDSITITWEASEGADSYDIYRAEGSGRFDLLASRVPDTSYTDETALNGVCYSYTVTARNGDKECVINQACVSACLLPQPELVSAANDENGIRVTWNKVADIPYYNVYRRSADEEGWQMIAQVNGGTEYLDFEPGEGLYVYTVACTSSDFTFVGPKDETGLSVMRLSAPWMQNATNRDGGILVEWSAVSGAETYSVTREAANGTVEKFTGIDSTSWLDESALASGRQYTYTVSAVCGDAESACSETRSVVRLYTPMLSALTDSSSVTLSWGMINGAETYNIYRKVSGGTWVLLAKGVTLTNYRDTDIKAGYPYIYTVRAVCTTDSGDCLSYFDESCIVKIPGTISGTCGENVTWALDDNGVLTISGSGSMTDYGTTPPWWDCRHMIQSVVVENGVTSVGRDSFIYCTNLQEVTLADTVETIGSFAFAYGTMTTVRFGSGLRSIGEAAFDSCANLTAVSLTGIETLGNSAFRYCSSLETVTLDGSLTEIGEDMFAKCYALTDVIIPASVTEIGVNAFSECNALTAVTLPAGLKTIGEWAFECSGLTGVEIPVTVETIGYGAFSSCVNLTDVNIPANVTEIGSFAFGNCWTLTAITVDSANENYSAEDGLLFNKDKTTLLAYPGAKAEAVEIPSGVTVIGAYAFNRNRKMTSVTIPDTVTTIGNAAFGNCGALTEVEIPASVTEIASEAFSSSNIERVTIGTGVKTIGDYAFAHCTQFAITITFEGDAPTIGSNIFQGDAGVTVHYSSEKQNWTSDIMQDYGVGWSVTWVDDYAPEPTPDPEPVEEYYDVTAAGETYSSMNYAWTTPNEEKVEDVNIESGTLPASVGVAWSGNNIYVQGRPVTAGTYNVVISAQTADCLYHVGVTVTIEAVAEPEESRLAAPAHVTAVNGTDGIHITWASVDGAKYYTVLYRAAGDVSWKALAQTENADTLEYIAPANRFTDGSEYHFTVKSCSNEHAGAYDNTNYAVITYIAPPVFTLENTADGITVRWTDVANASGYLVRRRAASETEWTLLTGDSITGNSYADNTAEKNICYYYTVQAVNADGVSGCYDSTGKMAMRLDVPELPTVVNGADGTVISWDAVEGAVSYAVMRKTGDNGAWTQIGTTTGCTYSDSAVASGTTYSYTVAVYDEGSDYVGGYASDGTPVLYLAAPTVSNSTLEDGTIKITWNAVMGAESYDVYRREADGTFGEPLFDKLGSTSYTDYDTKNGVVYYYAVAARCGETQSCLDQTGIAACALPRPELVSVVNDEQGIRITWNEVTDISTYYVYRKASTATDWETLAVVQDGCEYIDTLVEDGVTYTYSVASASADESFIGAMASQSMSLTRLPAPTLARVGNRDEGILVEWNAYDGATKYIVYRQKAGGDCEAIAETDSTSWLDQNKLVQGTQYTYTISAVCGAYESVHSGNGLTIVRLNTPMLSASVDANSITLNWTSSPGVEKYRIYRKPVNDEKWTVLANTYSDITSFKDTDVKAGYTYYYTVRAIVSTDAGECLSYFDPDFSVKAMGNASGTCGDNLTWALDDNGVLTISGTGAMTDGNMCCGLNIKSVVLEEGVTSVGSEAFENCGSLTSVTIPASVTSVGDAAFKNCTYLSVVTFKGCPEISAAMETVTEVDSEGNETTVTLNNGAFAEDTLTAYYPAGQWNAAQLRNYGADSITWTAVYNDVKVDTGSSESTVTVVVPQSTCTVDTTDTDIPAETTETIAANTSVTGVQLTSDTVKTEEGEADNGAQAVVNAALALETEDSEKLTSALAAESADKEVTVTVDVVVKPIEYEVPTEGETGKAATAVFSLEPVATVTVTDNGTETAKVEGVPVENSMLDTSSAITVELYTGFRPDQIVHKDKDGTIIEVFSGDEIAYDESTGICTVTIDHFSTLTAVKDAETQYSVSGDCDGDGIVNLKDLLTLKKALAAGDVSKLPTGADVDGENGVNLKDYLLLKQMLAGVTK